MAVTLSTPRTTASESENKTIELVELLPRRNWPLRGTCMTSLGVFNQTQEPSMVATKRVPRSASCVRSHCPTDETGESYDASE